MGNETAILDRAAAPYRHMLTVDEFLILDEAGAFEKLGRVELIEGEIFVMAPLYRPHAWVLAELTVDVGLSVRGLGSPLQILSPVSAKLNLNSLPEPDLLVIDTTGADEQGFVTPEMLRLVIEVAASSLAHDLGDKLCLYARSGVPEYWVADVNARQIIRLHAPRGADLLERATFAFGDTVPSATIPGLTVDTARLAG